MNKFNFEEINTLIEMYEDTIETIEIEPNLYIPIYGEDFSYHNLFNEIIDEKKTPEASLMEFFGAHLCAVNNNESRSYLSNLLFHIPLDEMPLLITSNEDNKWKEMLAKWRLKIGK